MAPRRIELKMAEQSLLAIEEADNGALRWMRAPV